jgi:hypothetical protein
VEGRASGVSTLGSFSVEGCGGGPCINRFKSAYVNGSTRMRERERERELCTSDRKARTFRSRIVAACVRGPHLLPSAFLALPPPNQLPSQSPPRPPPSYLHDYKQPPSWNPRRGRAEGWPQVGDVEMGLGVYVQEPIVHKDVSLSRRGPPRLG